MKNNPLTRVFILSFVPYLLLVILSIGSSIFGASFFPGSSKSYGIGTGIAYYSLLLIAWWPVLAICIAFQIYFLVKIESANKDEIKPKK